jgi:hypothetical protein
MPAAVDSPLEPGVTARGRGAGTKPPVQELHPLALLPAHRIVAFYGNPLSPRMGILGALEPEAMMDRLAEQAAAWASSDRTHPVLPALHLVSVVAQRSPGRDGRHRLRTADSVVQRVAQWAEARGWLLFLDIQPGLSTVRDEVTRLVPLLQRPRVHLALDPEFAMAPGQVPGDVIGTLDADDVNEAIDILARVVDQHSLPPKILVVHRFTEGMLTGLDRIRDDNRVQVVIDMDGFGAPPLKRATYRACVALPDVRYAGFKLFYQLDDPLLSEMDVLALDPKPVFVLYQ